MMYVVQRRLDEYSFFVVTAAVVFGPQLMKTYRLGAWCRLLHRRRRVPTDRHLNPPSLYSEAAENRNQARKQDAKLFLKVVVEPTVKERVALCRSRRPSWTRTIPDQTLDLVARC